MLFYVINRIIIKYHIKLYYYYLKTIVLLPLNIFTFFIFYYL